MPISITQPFLNAKQEASNRFLKKKVPRPEGISASAVVTDPLTNVVGVGLGEKISDGRLTGQACVRLYVERKIGRNAIPAEHMLPSNINGLPTDILEVGRFQPFLAAVPAPVPIVTDPQSRIRPVQPGCSIGFQFSDNSKVMAGTLGAIVEHDAGKLYLLSNNHVLADENQLSIGSDIFQPGLLDDDDPGNDKVAQLTAFVSLDASNDNSVDCALAAVVNASDVSAVPLPNVGSLKDPTPLDPQVNMTVHKVGRTTNYTQGTIFDINADVKVTYGIGELSFTNQILISGDSGQFSDAGDSGSLIVSREAQQAVGLLFAGSAKMTIANYFSQVLQQLSIQMGDATLTLCIS